MPGHVCGQGACRVLGSGTEAAEIPGHCSLDGSYPILCPSNLLFLLTTTLETQTLAGLASFEHDCSLKHKLSPRTLSAKGLFLQDDGF